MNDNIIKELQKPLNPAHVKPPPKGKFGEYLEAWHVINEANRIFGHHGWSYEPIGAPTLTNASVKDDKHHVGYMAMVRVHVAELGRTAADVGHGQGHGKSEGDAHESAAKEAVTDALKRALRTFGNPFGHALYDKEKRDVGVDPKDEWIGKIRRKDPWLATLFEESGYGPDTDPKKRAVTLTDAIISQFGRKKTRGELDNEYDRRQSNIDALEKPYPELHSQIKTKYNTMIEQFDMNEEAA